MSAHDAAKPTKREPWEVLEDILAEAEMERLEALTPEQLDAEMRAKGFDPDDIPTVEQVLADAAKRQAARETPTKGAARPNNVRALPLPAPVPASPRRLLWLAAAAFLLALGSVAFVERSAIVAIFVKPDPSKDILPDPEPERAAAETEAEHLRVRAAEECDGKFFLMCLSKLNEAAKLDPSGDRRPKVQELRAVAEAGIQRIKDRAISIDAGLVGDPK